MSTIISLLVTFISLWILVTLFDSGIDYKMKRIIILAFVMAGVSFVGKLFGVLDSKFNRDYEISWL